MKIINQIKTKHFKGDILNDRPLKCIRPKEKTKDSKMSSEKQRKQVFKYGQYEGNNFAPYVNDDPLYLVWLYETAPGLNPGFAEWFDLNKKTIEENAKNLKEHGK